MVHVRYEPDPEPPPGHCHGCICSLMAADVIMIPVAASLFTELAAGSWSNPVQIMIEPRADAPGGWEMTCRTNQ